MKILLEGIEREIVVNIRNILCRIDFDNQEVIPCKELPHKEFFYFSDISHEDFFNLVLKLNFKESDPCFFVSTILRDYPIYQFHLESTSDQDDYFNLMYYPKEIGLKVPDAGLIIIKEQILLYGLGASWFIHADRYIDKATLYSESPIIVDSFWKGRGIDSGVAPDFEW